MFWRSCVSSVVLPLPKKPDRIVIGMGPFGSVSCSVTASGSETEAENRGVMLDLVGEAVFDDVVAVVGMFDVAEKALELVGAASKQRRRRILHGSSLLTALW